MNKEVWRDIKGYEGIYQVSNLGRVKSLQREVNNTHCSKRTINEAILSVKRESHQYNYVTLHRNNKGKRAYIHRLVAQEFIPNPNNYSEVNHKNEIKKDNRVENLEWCSRKYNINYGTGKRRMVESRNAHNKWNAERKVYMYDKEGVFVKEFRSVVEAARFLNCADSSIRPIIDKKNRSAFGYIFSSQKKDKLDKYIKGGLIAVQQYTLDDVFVNSFQSMSEASRSTGSNLSKICDCLHGRRKYTNGYKWKVNS